MKHDTEKPIKAAVLTISDRCSRGEAEDKSGPAIVELLLSWGMEVIYRDIIPDELELIRARLVEVCDKLGAELVITTGGTGFSPRDVTPEATLRVIERQAPGLAEFMRVKGAEITPHAVLSRGICGIRGRSLIINLPGSRKACLENLNIIESPLLHGLDILLGRSSFH